MARKGENIVKRKDGRWEARVICNRDENGKAKYRYLYGKTYSEAKAKKEYLISQIIACTPQVPKNTLTLNHLIQLFLSHKSLSVKESTLSHYKNLIQRYIEKPLGGFRLLQISREQIEAFAKQLLTNGKASGDGLSPKSVRDILSILKSMFKYAVTHNYMSSALLNFSMPRLNSREISVLEPSEQKKLETFSIEKEDSYKFGVCLCLYTGLRMGEICSLKWADIDFKQSLLHVSRTIQRITAEGTEKKTKIIITEPKTKTSVRSIPIPAFLLKILTAKKLLIKNENAYVLTGTEKYIEPSNYYMKYKRWLRQLNLPSYSFHALRHTFATRCIEKNFDAKSLSEILGHSDVKITLNRYVHPSMDLKRSHMERLTPVSSQSKSVSVFCVKTTE